MPNLSSVTTNLFTTADETYADNLSSSILATAATVPVNSIGRYTAGQQAVITVEPGTSNQATFTGTVSGNSFINCIWTEGNLTVGHAGGKAVVDYDSATHFAMLTKAVAKEHNVNGTHGAITPTSISVNSQTWASLVTGWLEATETWTYASASTFTIPGDVTTKYTVGTKIRFSQLATTKYFYVASSSFSTPNTTVTIMLTSDNTLTNNTITLPFYSYSGNAVGFPSRMNFVPAITGQSGGTISMCAYTVANRQLTLYLRYTPGGANISGAVTVSLPATMSSTLATVDAIVIGNVGFYDNSATSDYSGAARWATNTTLALWYIDATVNKLGALSATVPFTWATSDQINAMVTVPL